MLKRKRSRARQDSPDKMLSRDFVLMFACRFGYSSVFLMLTAVVVPYAIEAYGANDAQAGIAVGAFIVAALLSRLLVGGLLQARGYRGSCKIAAVGFFVTSLLYLPALSFVPFLLVRMCNGLFFGFLSNIVASLAVFVVPKKRLGEGMGYLSLSTNIPSAAGPFIGLHLCKDGDFSGVFIVTVLFAVLALITGLLIDVDAPTRALTCEDPNKPGNVRESGFSQAILPFAVPLCSIMLFAEMFYTGTTSFVSVYANAMGAADAVSWFFVSYSITTILSRPGAGRLLDEKGDLVVFLPAFIFCGLGYFALGILREGWAIVLSGALLALGRGTILGTIQAMAVMGVPPEKVGAATATFYLFADAGSGLGPMVSGVAASLLGDKGALFWIQGVLVGVLLCYYLIIRAVGRLRVEK